MGSLSHREVGCLILKLLYSLTKSNVSILVAPCFSPAFGGISFSILGVVVGREGISFPVL